MIDINPRYPRARSKMNCTDKEYIMICEVLGNNYTREDFLESLHESYDRLRTINLFNAFSEIMIIMSTKDCYKAFCDNSIGKGKMLRMLPYLERMYNVLQENNITRYTRKEWNYFLTAYDLSSSVLTKYTDAENPELMTYKEFIDNNNLGYHKDYFVTIAERLYDYHREKGKQKDNERRN